MVRINLCSWLFLLMTTLLISACAPAELKNYQKADTPEAAYRAYNALVEHLSRIPMIQRGNPWYTPWGKAIRAEWAGNYRGAETAYREAIVSLENFAGDNSDEHRAAGIPIIRGELGNVLVLQGRYGEAVKEFKAGEPTAFGYSRLAEKSKQSESTLYLAHLFTNYGRSLEQTGEIKRAIGAYRKGIGFGASGLSADIARLKKADVLTENSRFQAVMSAREALAQGQTRVALQHYMAALSIALNLQIDSTKSVDFSVAAGAIETYQRLEPKPVISEEARKRAVFAATATKMAENNRGLEHAIDEYLKAISLAPWWADLYVNLALLQEQLEYYPAAIESLRLYLLAAPDAIDASSVQTKIYELEYKGEVESPGAERFESGGNDHLILGIIIAPRDGGLHVQDIRKGWTGDAIGLAADDLILRFNETEVKTAKEFVGAVKKVRSGEEFSMVVRRGTEVGRIVGIAAAGQGGRLVRREVIQKTAN